MLAKVLENLNIKPGGKYIDCNLGGGGHTKEILKRGGRVLGIDVDPEAIGEVSKWRDSSKGILNQVQDDRSGLNDKDLILAQGDFANLRSIAKENGFENVGGILFDLGVSTHQLETAERGFSFNKEDAPLDMRMSPELAVTAADLVNGLNTGELAELFSKYGEENWAKPIAKAIVEKRPLRSAQELTDLILKVRPRTANDRTHPATRVFQALRIAVNDELNSLKAALPQTVDLLKPGGRLVVISFHSLEDRIVKQFMAEEEERGILKILTDSPIVPTDQEVSANPRARSGKLRVSERV